MVEQHKIQKIYEKEFKNFTAFNINVNSNGEDVWLNGYLGKENRAWKEGDLVDVEVWYDEKGDRWKYKPAEAASQQNNQGPPRNSGSGLPSSPDGVTNAEIKHLLLRIGDFLNKLDKKVEALGQNKAPEKPPAPPANQQPQNNNGGPYENQQRPQAEQQENSGPQAPWDTIDDDLPF